MVENKEIKNLTAYKTFICTKDLYADLYAAKINLII